MLPTSRFFHFLDTTNNFALHFLEGQKLIQDLVLLHEVKGQGMFFFRRAVLTILPMISFLKPGETLGLYIDSEDPYFRMKLETNDQGQLRTLLVPETFDQNPEKLLGQARLVKYSPHNKAPYTSIQQLDQISLEGTINQFLSSSYQVQSQIIIGEYTDHALIISKLPTPPVHADENLTLPRYLLQCQMTLRTLLNRDFETSEEIVREFEKVSYQFLGVKNLVFQCQCSKEKMLENLVLLSKTMTEDLFADGDALELKCDYCKAKYTITSSEFHQYSQNSPT